MTRQDLETSLAKIGWRISQSGNGLNDFIINYRGEKTDLVVYDDRLDVRVNLFGGDSSLGKGTCVFYLEELTLTDGGDNGKTEYVCINFGNKNYIQFYNHEQ